MVDLCRHLGYQGSADLAFTTQQTNDDGSRPDLVARAVDGSVPIVLEAKFWAGLTSHQPVSYLNALPDRGLLVFIAPAGRNDTLWLELLRRSGDEFVIADEVSRWHDTRAVRVGTRVLALVSWQAMLTQLHEAATLAGEASASDIRQLTALCDKMDTEGFLPLRSEDLTSDLGRRVFQFCELADSITNMLVASKYADVSRLRSQGGQGWYGRYLRMRGHGALLYFDAQRWGRRGQSPLWIAIYGKEFQPCTVEPDILRGADVSYHMENGHCMVAIVLLECAELEAVVDHALAQVRHLLDLLPDYSGEASHPFPAPVDPEFVSK